MEKMAEIFKSDCLGDGKGEIDYIPFNVLICRVAMCIHFLNKQ